MIFLAISCHLFNGLQPDANPLNNWQEIAKKPGEKFEQTNLTGGAWCLSRLVNHLLSSSFQSYASARALLAPPDSWYTPFRNALHCFPIWTIICLKIKLVLFKFLNKFFYTKNERSKNFLESYRPKSVCIRWKIELCRDITGLYIEYCNEISAHLEWINTYDELLHY